MQGGKMNTLNNLQQQINKNYEKEKNAITMVTIGTSSLIIYTPIYLSHLTLQEIILTIIETGLIIIPIAGIKKMRKSNQIIKLTRKKMKGTLTNKNKDIKDSLQIIENDLSIKIKKESNKKQKKKLIKLKKKIKKQYP